MKKTNVFIVILATALVVTITTRLLPFAFDDAYIHFRIAENLAQFGKPYFNPDEPVMATSSPLWTYLLAILSLSQISLPLLAAFLNAIFTVAGSAVWTIFLRKTSGTNLSALWAGIFQLAYIAILTPSAVGLMEIPLALFLLGLAVFLLSRHNAFGWLCFALSIFTRLEMVVFLPLFAAPYLRTKEKRLYWHLLYFVIPAAILAGITFFFFHTLIPHAAVAKQVIYTLSRMKAFLYIVFKVFPFFDQLWAGLLVLAGVFFLFIFALHNILWKSVLRHREHIWLLSVGAGGLIIILAYVFKHIHLFNWYIPLFTVPIIAFFFVISPVSGVFPRVFALVLIIYPIFTLVQYTLGACSPQFIPGRDEGARVQRYLETGEILYRLFPNFELMTSEIGGLGYAFKGKLLDGAGLITPAALKYHPMEVGVQRSNPWLGAIPPGFVEEQAPELIVSYPLFVEEFAISPYRNQYLKISVPAFSDIYRLKTKTDKIWGCDTLYIYIRRDVADPAKVQILKNELCSTLD